MKATYSVLPILPHGEQTFVPEPGLAPRVCHAVPDLALHTAGVPVVATHHPNRVFQGGLDAVGVGLLGRPLQGHHASTALEHRPEDTKRVVDCILNG